MIKTSSTQKGSAHVVIIVILVIALVGALGFVFWQNFMQKSDDKKTADQSTSKNEQKAEPKKDDNLIKLADWGVELTIPDGLKTTSVKYNKDATKDTPPREIYVFTTARIQALGGECTKSPFGNTVILNRFADESGPFPESYWVSPTEVGGYTYVASGPIAGCSMVDENGRPKMPLSEVEKNDRDLLVDLVKTLKTSE